MDISVQVLQERIEIAELKKKRYNQEQLFNLQKEKQDLLDKLHHFEEQNKLQCSKNTRLSEENFIASRCSNNTSSSNGSNILYPDEKGNESMGSNQIFSSQGARAINEVWDVDIEDSMIKDNLVGLLSVHQQPASSSTSVALDSTQNVTNHLSLVVNDSDSNNDNFTATTNKNSNSTSTSKNDDTTTSVTTAGSDSSEYKIAIHRGSLKKKNYTPLPTTGVIEKIQDDDESDLYFSFHKYQYHPLCLMTIQNDNKNNTSSSSSSSSISSRIDNNLNGGKFIKQNNVKLEMSVELHTENKNHDDEEDSNINDGSASEVNRSFTTATTMTTTTTTPSHTANNNNAYTTNENMKTNTPAMLSFNNTGVYWFNKIKQLTAGKYILTFHSPTHPEIVEPLIHEVIIAYDEKVYQYNNSYHNHKGINSKKRKSTDINTCNNSSNDNSSKSMHSITNNINNNITSIINDEVSDVINHQAKTSRIFTKPLTYDIVGCRPESLLKRFIARVFEYDGKNKLYYGYLTSYATSSIDINNSDDDNNNSNNNNNNDDDISDNAEVCQQKMFKVVYNDGEVQLLSLQQVRLCLINDSDVPMKAMKACLDHCFSAMATLGRNVIRTNDK